MQPVRRETIRVLAGWSAVAGATGLWRPAAASSLAALSDAQTADGLRAALEQGARAAVSRLGRADGFLSNLAVRIPLPRYLEDAARVGRALGLQRQFDELVVSMNRAAEAAVPQAQSMLVSAVKSMTVTDAKRIVSGGSTSVTEFFRSRTAEPLFAKFLPTVRAATEQVGLAQRYNALVTQVPVAGQPKIEHHVTTKALDGLYFVIGEEEKAIRANPLRAASAAARTVFGALR